MEDIIKLLPTFILINQITKPKGRLSSKDNLLSTQIIWLNIMHFILFRFICGLTYYGLSLNATNMPGNPYLIFSVTMLAEWPGCITAAWVTKKCGRRIFYSSVLVLAGIACLAAGLINDDSK